MICLALHALAQKPKKEGFYSYTDVYYDSMSGIPRQLDLKNIRYAFYKNTSKPDDHFSSAYLVLGDMVLTWGKSSSRVVKFHEDIFVPFKYDPAGVIFANTIEQDPWVPDANENTEKEGDHYMLYSGLRVGYKTRMVQNRKSHHNMTSNKVSRWGFYANNTADYDFPIAYLAIGTLDPDHVYMKREFEDPEVRKNIDLLTRDAEKFYYSGNAVIGRQRAGKVA